MKTKLNFKLDEPNQNGRIYKKLAFLKAVSEASSRGPLVVFDSFDSALKGNLMNAVASVMNTEEIDNEVFLDIKFLDKNINAFTFKSLLEAGSVVITSAGTGDIGKDNIVKDYRIQGFFFTPSEIK